MSRVQVPPGPPKKFTLVYEGVFFLENLAKLDPRHINGMSRVRTARRQFARPEPGLRMQPSEAGSRKFLKEIYRDQVPPGPPYRLCLKQR